MKETDTLNQFMKNQMRLLNVTFVLQTTSQKGAWIDTYLQFMMKRSRSTATFVIKVISQNKA